MICLYMQEFYFSDSDEDMVGYSGVYIYIYMTHITWMDRMGIHNQLFIFTGAQRIAIYATQNGRTRYPDRPKSVGDFGGLIPEGWPHS